MDPAWLGTMLQAMIIYPNPDMGSNIATARNMVEHFLFAGQKQDTWEQVAMSYEPIAHNTEGTVRTMRFHMYVCGNAQPKVIQHYTCIADVPSFAQPTVQESWGSLYLGIQAAQPQDELDVIMEVPKWNLGSVKAVWDDGKTAKLKPESFQEKSQQEVTHINGPANWGGWVEMPRNAAQIFLNRLGIDDENVSGNHSNLTAGDYILYAMYQRNGSWVIVYVADRLEQKKMFAWGKGKDKTAPCKVSAFVRTPDGRFFQHETIIERGDLPEVRPEKNPFQIVGGLKGTQIMTLDPKDPTQQVSEKKGAEYVVETRQRYARNWV